MHRAFGIAIVGLWLAAMGKLIERDVLPAWTAQSPPKLLAPGARESQSAILLVTGERRQRVGTAWSVFRPVGEQFRQEGTIALTAVPGLPPVQIGLSIMLTADGVIDDFELEVLGVRDPFGKPLKIEMRGESYGRYIPCTLQIGPFKRSFKLDAAASRVISDGVRPFDTLRNLRVGQSWRMQMLDPISAVLGQQARIHPLIAKVERKETIEHRGSKVDCFVVTAGRARAWVAEDGRVLVQEAEVPGLGRLEFHDEPYDDESRIEARRTIGKRAGVD